MSSNINVFKFLSVGIQLANQSAKIIREVQLSKNL